MNWAGGSRRLFTGIFWKESWKLKRRIMKTKLFVIALIFGMALGYLLSLWQQAAQKSERIRIEKNIGE